jgi:hypothetical protein
MCHPYDFLREKMFYPKQVANLAHLTVHKYVINKNHRKLQVYSYFDKQPVKMKCAFAATRYLQNKQESFPVRK